jgi:hypothetical protein
MMKVSPFTLNKKSKKFSKKSTRLDKSGITKLIKSTIQKSTEKKIFTDYATNFAIVTAASSTPVARSLLPLISQGAAKSQRIGNEIRVRKAILNIMVNLLPYNASTNNLTTPCWVKIWVLRYRMENTTNFNATVAASNFFETNNSSVPFQGSLLDMVLNVDVDLYDVIEERTCKLGASAYESAGLTNNTGYFDNSPMSQRFVIDVTKGFNKIVKYNDNGSTTPTNCNLFVVWQAVTAAGTSSAGQSMAEYHIGYRVEYTDN